MISILQDGDLSLQCWGGPEAMQMQCWFRAEMPADG